MKKISNVLSIEDAIINRRSVRGYLKKEVPKRVINNIFQLAQRAPSNSNNQPWNVYVSSGKSKDRLRDQMVKNVLNKVKPNSDYDYPVVFKFNL